jgi:hypothetical protein
MMLTNQEIIGDLGEILYHSLFGGIPSDDKYDSEKDHVDHDGGTVQIKTQSRHPYGCFTVNTAHKQAFKNCFTVKKLIFIEYSLSDIITVYECIDRTYYTTMTSDGRRMACFPVDNMSVIYKLKNKKLAGLFRNFTNSKILRHHE